MAWLTYIVIWNAAIAALLGALACLLAPRFHSAAVGHTLWIVTLIALFTPGLVDVPLPVLSHKTETESAALLSDGASFRETKLPSAGGLLGLSSKLANPSPDDTSAKSSYSNEVSWETWLFAIWITGAILVGAYQIYVTWLMTRLMKLAKPDPRIDRSMHRIARRHNIKNYPTARVVPWVGSPMLWGLGGTSVIVLPKQLLDVIDDDATDALLLHELAHFQRGDQWVRIIEVVASVVFWWHPVVWIAIQNIEVYEEQCCDGWVVSKERSKRRSYAEALLDTVDFIAEAPETAKPVAASGLGRIPLLRKRIQSIMCAKEHASPPWKFVIVASLVGLALLQPRLVEARGSSLGGTKDLPAPTILAQSEMRSATIAEQNPSTKPDFLGHLKQSLDEKIRDSAPIPEIEYATAGSPYGTFRLTAISGRRAILEQVLTGGRSDLSKYKITCAAFTPPNDEAPQFAAGSEDGAVRLFDCVSAEPIQVICQLQSTINSVDYSNDGKWIAIGSNEDSLFVWNSMTDELSEYKTSGRVACVRFAPDAHTVVVTAKPWGPNTEGRVEIWDLESKARRYSMTCSATTGVASLSTANEVLLAEWDGRLRIVGTDGVERYSTQVMKDSVSAAAFSSSAVMLQNLLQLSNSQSF